MLDRSRRSALIISIVAVPLPIAVMYASRILQYLRDEGQLEPIATIVVFLIFAPLIVFLVSRYIYSRFKDNVYYGLSGVLRWALFGAILAILCFGASYVLPPADREGDLVPYVLFSLLDFIVFCLAMVVSFHVAFFGVEVDKLG